MEPGHARVGSGRPRQTLWGIVLLCGAIAGWDGIPVGRLSLPVYRAELLRVRDSGITGWAALELETTIPSTSHELLDVAGGRIAVLRTGEMGEEFIEVYSVELP